FDYYEREPWLGFHPAVSQLLQRPREIIEVTSARDPAPEFAPAPLPTHGGEPLEFRCFLAAQMFAASFAPQMRDANLIVEAHTLTTMSLRATSAGAPTMFRQMARHY